VIGELVIGQLATGQPVNRLTNYHLLITLYGNGGNCNTVPGFI
jgi:hypothetical protein